MLFPQKNRSAIQTIILTSLLTLLASCGNSAALEGLVSADPQLKEDQAGSSPNISSSQTAQNPASIEDRDSLSLDPQGSSKPGSSNQNSREVVSKNQQPDEQQIPQASTEFDNLLINFPESFPVYPQAQLQEVKSAQDQNSGILIWHSGDNRQAVANFYQAELIANDWKIVKPFNINPKHPKIRAIAVKDDLKVDLTLVQSSSQVDPKRDITELALSYQPISEENSENVAQVTESIDSAEPLAPKPDSEDTTQYQPRPDQLPSELSQPESLNSSETDDNYFTSADGDFADLDEVPDQLQQPLESVAALGILTPYTGKANVELTKFAPNEIITRGEYARWLIAANNRYYSDDPSKKIYIAAKTNQPAFKDVKAQHPDFEAIQSLAEAGLIPSRLTEDSTKLLFRPDSPLTREDLITWKVPLDTRQALPKASLEAIQESWGFQDAANTDSAAIRALYADFQNGDLSNIRRIFGYTTLFQPKKPVTRAEAAASLNYFGFQGDGITAKEVLSAETETES
ncbi:MAG: S-layer homology domain-containing protein [Cyanobacteria bacterium P01_G01_bin.39]